MVLLDGAILAPRPGVWYNRHQRKWWSSLWVAQQWRGIALAVLRLKDQPMGAGAAQPFAVAWWAAVEGLMHRA